MKLYPYQKRAVDLITTQKKALIAYEMGLGKTPITITAMEQLMEDGKINNPVLVVVLSSLRYQWRNEIAKFAPNSVATVIDGTPKQRDEIYATAYQSDYVITTYDLIVRDYSWYQQRNWGAVILDEMTAIKSFRAKRSKAVKQLSRFVPVRVGLTGTPITNGKAEEIFSLMEFIEPNVLGKWWAFDKKYISRHPNGWVTRYRNLPELHRLLAPHVARKKQMDSDVKDFLPDVLDMDPRRIPLTRYQEKVYRHISRDLLRSLDEAQEMFGSTFTWNAAFHYGQSDNQRYDPVANEIQGQIMQAYSALRMLCDHPDLLIDSAYDYQAGEGKGSAYCWQLMADATLGLLSGQKAPKLEALLEYIKDQVEADPEVKIVVFATFTRLFPYIIAELDKAKIGYVQFHGGMNAKERDHALTQFKKGNPTVFLSSDAGGFGVDLPEASILINYNLPWSAGTALQRNSRIIRASSNHKQVRIERLLAEDTVEERQWGALQHKIRVSAGIVDGEMSDPSGNLENTVEGLRNFLFSDS